ncbi:mucin-5AC-like [Contarinia nasturtii]|uniref:mucin-5AC-like n=1 Tax=Contarinia nasturtii TaxID=265458 RepID=UPI0012D4708F|nr:mucin-5AC-like [Contarinia nasturtii]
MNYIVIILVAVATSMVSSLPAQNQNTRLRFMRKRSVSSNLDFDYEEEAFLPTTITTTTQTSTTVIARTIPTKKYPPANQGNSTVAKRPKNVSTKLDFGTELTATTVTKPTMPTTTTMSAKTTTTELLTTTKLPPTTTTMREFTTISSVPRTKTSTDFENDNSNTHHTITTTTIKPTIMTIDSTTRAVVIKEPDEVSKDTVILTSSTVPSILQTESPTQSKKESFNTDPTATASTTMPSTTVMRELNTISSIPQTETPSQSKNENFITNPMKTIITTQPTTIEASTTSAVIENKPDEVSKHEENTMISTSSTFPSIPQTEFPIQSINESSSSNHTCDPGHIQASSSVLNEIGNLCNATVKEAPNKDEPTHIKIEPYDNNVSPEDNAPTSTILPDELNTSQNKGGVPSATQSNILDQVAESCFEATDEPNDKRKKCTTSYTTEPTTNVMRDLSTISSQNENINTDPTKTIVTVQPTTSIMIENKPQEVPKDQENTVISTSTTISTLAETTPQSREENSSSSHTCDPGHTQASSSVLEEIGNLCNATVQEAPNKNEPTHIKIDPYDNIASPEDNAPTSTILPNELNTSQNKGGDTIVTQPNILDQIAESCHETTDEPNDNSKKCKTSYTTESTTIVTMELSTISKTVIRELDTSSITTQPTTIESSTTSAMIENKPEEVPKHEENIMISTTSTMPSIPRTESTTQSKNENSSSSHTCDTSNTQASSSVLEEIGNLCNATVQEAPNKDQPTHVKIDPYDNNASPEDNAPTSTILPNELNISQNKDGDTIVTQPNILDQIAESCHETTDEPNDESKKCNTPENKEDVTTTLIHTESSTMPSMVKETKQNTSSTSTETTVVHTELPSTSSVTKETSAITTSSPIQTIEIHTELSTMPSMDKETSPNTASPPIETTVIHTELSTTPRIAKETSTNTSSTSIEITEIHTESPTTSSVTKDISAITTSTSIETTVIHTESSTTSSMAKETLPNTASPIVTTEVHTESSSTTNLVKETSPSTSSTSIETAVIHTEPSTSPNIAKETSPNTSSSPIETTVIQTESSTNSNEVSVQKENIPENGATKLPEQNVVISTTFGNEVTKNDTVFIPGESTTTIAPSTISSHSNANQAVNEINNNQNEKEQGSTTVDSEKDSTRTFKNSISVTFSLLFIILLSNYFH